MAADAVTDLPPGFALDDEKPVKRSPAEDKLAVLAKLSPAERARDEQLQRDPRNREALRVAVANEKDPANRAQLQALADEEDRLSSAAAEPPQGFTVDELPAGFTLDAAKGSNEGTPPQSQTRKVGVLESAGRTAGGAAIPVVRTLGLAAALIGRVFGRDAQDTVFRKVDETLESMRSVYSPREGEDFSLTGSILGGVASAPIEVVGGFGAQHGIDRAGEVLERGGTLGEAAKAGAVTGGVRTALNALPVKVGGRVGSMFESKVGATLGGGLSGGTLATTSGIAGRKAENMALPEGEQFADLRSPEEASPVEFGLGAAFGAVPGAARAATGIPIVRKVVDAAIEAATPQLSPTTMKRAATAVEAGIPISPHQLSGNKFVKLLGETAESVPGAGGAQLKQARRDKFSAALAKQLDPETTATVLDDATFKELQDAAGERIGEISSKYEVPVDDFGDLNAVARRDTPDVQAVIKTFADDLAQIAAENGGVVPGDTLRKLRTEAQSRARNTRGAKPDLGNALDDLVHRLDDALANNIADPADVAALTDARRRYAVSKTLEPLLAKYPDGNFPPSALKGVVTSTKQGKRRMARGEGGEMGEYARVGQDLLKEQVSSNTAERAAVYSVLGDAAKLFKVGALWLPSAAYNFIGPRVVKRLVEAQAKRNAPRPEGPPPEPTLGQGFEDVPQGTRPAGPGPLGDLTPDWETAPGAAAAREQGVDPTGMVRAVDEGAPLPQGIPQRPGAQIPLAESRPLGDLTPDWETSPGAGGPARAGAEPGLVPAVGEAPPTTGPRAGLDERAGRQIPAVPGRPDLPDTLVAGGPAEVAATDTANAAMGTPGAIEARRQQGMARVEQAAAAERAEPVPVGEATEIRPQEVKPAPEMPDEKIPVGEATEIKPEVVKPAPEIPEHPEVAKVKEAILKKRDAEAKKRAAADELRKAAEVEPDPEVKAALIKRAEAVTPKEKADVSTDKSVGTGDLRKEAGQESAPKDGGAKAPKAAGEESLDLGLPNLDEAFLDTQLRAKAKTEPPPTPRGRRQSRRAIEQGIADGTLDAEGGTLALWAMDQNPNLARGLRVEVDAPANAQAKGSYNSASQIVKLFKGQTNPQTAIHEILHHAERLMPEPVQQGIRRSWERAVKKIMSEATPERRQAMEAMDKASGGDADALQTVKKAFADGVLTKEDYQFVNPTEYWAVNGARILHERFTGRGSWRAQAKQWMKEMIEQVKGTAGMPSESAILKALDEVLNPKSVTGQQKSATMIKSFVGPIPDKIKAR
ncbi:MAG: hypothetical protein QG602_783 [Verrucomicrobiota bacterium]|nr:hypothetical protein [Verrucomicrobiota bacterium]